MIIIPLKIGIDIPHCQTCPSIPSRTLLGGWIPSEPISLEHYQISQSHRFLLCLCGTTISSGQNQCNERGQRCTMSWQRQIQGSRCRKGSIQRPTTVVIIQVQWNGISGWQVVDLVGIHVSTTEILNFWHYTHILLYIYYVQYHEIYK